MTQWKTIDSAPRDEGVMVAFDEPFFGVMDKRVTMGYYDSETEE